MSKDRSPSENVLWEPAVYTNEQHTHVRLCLDNRVLKYDDNYMRKSGAWFSSSTTGKGDCFPVLMKETDEV